jgi:hypothetical protein
MLRRLLLASLSIALLLGSACTGPKIIVASPRPLDQPIAKPQAADSSKIAGFAFIAQPHFQYIFAPRAVILGDEPPPPTDVQGATENLAATVATHKRLKLTPLPSTEGTVALAFEEFSSGKQQWGGVMIPEERKLFGRFASDTRLGEWLIVLDDVIVSDGADPIPLTAYRWPRSAVEAYAACGIPPQFVIEDCTHAFYSASDTMYVMRGSGTSAGQ